MWGAVNNKVAQIGQVQYDTLQEAIDDVPTDGTPTTITILKNIVLDAHTVTKAGQNITLNIGPYTISNGVDRMSIIENSATLNIINGKITSNTTDQGAINNNSGGNLTISGGRIEATGLRQAVYNNGGTITITGNAYLSAASNERAPVQNNTGTMTITGGTMVSTGYAALDITGGTVTIGTQGGGVDVTSPVLQGATYGITNRTNTARQFKMYDGIIKFKTEAYNTSKLTMNGTEQGYHLMGGSETIGGETYQTAFLGTGYTVIFNAMGGTTSEPARTFNDAGTLGTPLPTATKPYNTFLGWFDDPDSGTQITGNEYINSDVTYYAHWSSYTVTITFNGNGGTPSEPSRDITAGNYIGPLPTASRTNYIFDGWFTAASGGTAIDENSIFGENTPVYAHWSSANYVAKIGTTTYNTLAAALLAVPTTGVQTTVELYKNTVEAVEIASGQNIILDLNGYTLSNNGSKKSAIGKRAVTMENFGGTITIMNGTITANTDQAAINNTGGTMYIIDTDVSQTRTNGNKPKQAIYNDGGTLTISGNSNITAGNNGTFNNADRGAIQNLNSGILTITGGTVTSTASHGIVNEPGSTFTLGTVGGGVSTSIPSIKGEKCGIQNFGTFNFYDGIAKGKTYSISGAIADTESGYQKADGTEGSYHTAFLEAIATPTPTAAP